MGGVQVPTQPEKKNGPLGTDRSGTTGEDWVPTFSMMPFQSSSP
jgi:hypothetical protein